MGLIDELGTKPDSALAARYGLHERTVCQYRNKEGVKPFEKYSYKVYVNNEYTETLSNIKKVMVFINPFPVKNKSSSFIESNFRRKEFIEFPNHNLIILRYEN